MLEFIYFVQSKLIAEGTRINNVIALFCALIAIILIGYLVESKKWKYKQNKQNDKHAWTTGNVRKFILSLTDSSNFIDLLYFIESAHDDADWCQSYR